MNQLLIIAIIMILGYAYYQRMSKKENFTCYPDIFDDKYHNIRTNYFDKNEAEKLLSRKPKYVNTSIIPLNKDVSNTIYFSAYSEDKTLVGYLKMAVSEKFMASLLDVGFFEQELFGFTGWFGYHVYEVVALDDEILHKLFKRAIHQLKNDGNRYYLSILCLNENLGKNLMEQFKFVLTLKEQSRRFYKDTLYTLVYYK